MKNLLPALAPLLVIGAAAGMPTAVNAEPLIYGSMIDNNSWSGWDRPEGIYSFTPTAGTSFTPVFTDGYDLAATAGGVMVDDVYHLFNYREGASTMWCVNYTSYNISDWSVTYSCYFSDAIASNDMTADPTTDMVYCSQKSGKDAKLAMWNPQKLDDISIIGNLETEIVAISSDAAGQLYGMGTDGGFYSIDKTDASMQKIGDTGITPKGKQSAVIDYNTGTLYWAAYTSAGKSALYTVDLTTGEATKVTDFANNARFCGLYMLSTTTDADAPAAVTDLKVNFSSGSNDGTITFTMPKKTYSGAALSGELTYSLDLDGESLATGQAEAGAKVELQKNIPTGEHLFVLVTANSAGESPRAKCTAYIGKGVPGYVNYPTATPTGNANEFLISWGAPDYCIPLDAYFDPKELRYDVVRQPDGLKIADHIAECSVIDVIEYDGPLTTFKYDVTAYIDDLHLPEYTTNGVAVGSALIPPYEVHMASADLSYFTIIDANGDGSTWCKDFNGYGVGCGGRWDGACDDWLILPPMKLESKGLYHTTITVGHDYDGPSAWELYIGTAPTPEGMTQQVLEKSSTAVSFDDDIRVAESGTYYIGIRCVGTGGTTMYVADIIIRDQASLDAPDAPVSVSGVGAERGELAAYVTFVTPSMTIGGDRLDSLTAANIYHGEKLVYTLSPVEPDTEYTCKVEADQEFNTYYVSAVNESGEGLRTKVEYVFAGFDYPGIIDAVTLTENGEGQPQLNWNAVTETGLYGYYVDPEAVTYEIYRGYGTGSYDLVAEEYRGTEFIDTELSADCDQFMLQYYVYPLNHIGLGYGTGSNSMCFGRAFEAPFTETFAGGEPDNSPWYFKTSDPKAATWSFTRVSDTNLEDIDGDNGMMTFAAVTPGEATLHAPFVTVKGCENPILEFYYYDGTFIAPLTVKVNDEELSNSATAVSPLREGWQRFKAPLDAYKDSERLKIEFTAASSNGNEYAFIDHMCVRDQHDYDLALSRIEGPEDMELGEAYIINPYVTNLGSKKSGEALLTLKRNGYEISTLPIPSLEEGEIYVAEIIDTVDVTFGETPEYEAVISYVADQDESNNSRSLNISDVKMPRYPAPENLKGSEQPEGVVLSWEAVSETTMAPEAITDDFESYQPFALQFGDWKLIDGDKAKTVVMPNPEIWYEDLEYPHSGEAMAYQIFNPEEAGIDTEVYQHYAPHSGSNAAVCWASADFGTPNDDWMISPRLYPGGQTISFYVYSRTGYFDFEKYEVLYSNGLPVVSNFKLLYEGSAPYDWQRIEVELPDDARFFAIHTVSSQSNTEIWFDDITFIPASLDPIPLELQGYNVYRDNVKVNTDLVRSTSFLDTAAPHGTHKYNVTAVYGVGESHLSADAVVNVESGIASAAASMVSVIPENGCIRILGAQGRTVRVCDISGVTLINGHVAQTELTVHAAPGVYIVTADADTFKVIVR